MKHTSNPEVGTFSQEERSEFLQGVAENLSKSIMVLDALNISELACSLRELKMKLNLILNESLVIYGLTPETKPHENFPKVHEFPKSKYTKDCQSGKPLSIT